MKKIIDLTHTISSFIPTWDGSCGFRLNLLQDYPEAEPNTAAFKVQSVAMNCGIGTHIDAPAHCFKDLETIEAIPLELLIAPGIVIDISQQVNPQTYLNVKDILKFEANHGLIEKNSYVLINTGWSRYWDFPLKYHNNYQFPYIDEEAAKLLVTRKVRGVGIDTLSPDRPESRYPVHRMLLSNEMFIIENLTNLGMLPPKQFTLTIAPIKIAGATEAPIRAWATF